MTLIFEQYLDFIGDGHGHHIPGTQDIYRHGWVPIGDAPPPPPFFGVMDSKSKHTLPNGDYTPERKALHARIIREALAGHKPEHDPKAIFMGGGPAAGKSVISKGLPDAVSINADDIMTKLPEYQHMVAAGDPAASTFSHREAADVADQLEHAAASRWISFKMDGTGDRDYGTMAGRIAEAHRAGYQAIGEYVTTDTDEAVRRARARAMDPDSDSYGRMVPESAIRAIHASVSKIFAQLAARDSFDKAELWDNNGPAPKLVGSKQPGGTWTVQDEQSWERFLAKEHEASGPR